MKYTAEEKQSIEALLHAGGINFNLAMLGYPDYSKEYLRQFKEVARLLNVSIKNLLIEKELVLLHNQLTELPESIGELTKLNTLNLNNNQLTELPESIGNLTNLDILDLHSNKLTKLPESIGNLTNLEWMDLDNNQLIKLPNSIESLPKLTKLWLADNPLAEDEKERIKKALPNCDIYFQH